MVGNKTVLSSLNFTLRNRICSPDLVLHLQTFRVSCQVDGICDRTLPRHCLPMPKLRSGIQQPFCLTCDLGIRCLRRTYLMFHFDIHDISLIARVAGEYTVLKGFLTDILYQCAPCVCYVSLSSSQSLSMWI